DEIIGLVYNLEDFMKADFEILDPLAQELLFNLQEDSFSALESIIEEKIAEKRLDDTKFPNKKFIQYRFAQIKIKVWAQKILQPHKSKAIQYHTTKFYGFDPRVISSKMERAEILLGKKISWTYHNENLITIE